MEAKVTGTDITNTKLDLKYNLIPGCTSLKRYSIYLIAKMWPQNIVKYIEQVLDDLAQTQAPQVFRTEGVSAKTKLIYEVKAEIESLKRKKQLTKATINTILNKYQRQLQEFGVKVVREEETSESEKQNLSVAQGSYEEMDESSNGNYENVEDVNYLVPDVSLLEGSQGDFNYICSQSETGINVSYARGELMTQQSEHIELSPIQSNVGSQRISQISPTNILSPMENTNASIDAAPSPSFGDPCHSKYLTPQESIKGSQPLFIQDSLHDRETSAGIREPSPFIYQDSNASGQFIDARSCSRSKEQLSFLVQDEEIYPSLEFFDDVPQNSSSEFFENAAPSRRLQSRNASFCSLNQSMFNVGLSANTVRTSTPLNVINQSREGADGASAISSVSATKFMEGFKGTSTPAKKTGNTTFGCVFEANQKQKSTSSSSFGGSKVQLIADGSENGNTFSVPEAPKTKKLKRTEEAVTLMTQAPEDDNRNSLTEKSSSSKASSNEAKLTGTSSERGVDASTSFADRSRNVHEASISSRKPTKLASTSPQRGIESSTSFVGDLEPMETMIANESLHKASVPSIKQTKTMGKEKPYDKRQSLAEKGSQSVSVSSTNQAKLPSTPFKRGVSGSTSFFGDSNPFTEQSRCVHEASLSPMKQVTSFQDDKQESLAEGSSQFASISSSNEAQLTSTAFEKRDGGSTSFFGNLKPFSEKSKSVRAVSNQGKFTTTPLKTNPSTSDLESTVDFGNASPLANKSFHEESGYSINRAKVTPLEREVDALATFSEHSKSFVPKSAERPESLQEASVSWTNRAKSKTNNASTSFFKQSLPKAFVPEYAKRPESLLEASVSCTNQAKSTAIPLQRESNTAISFFGNLNPFVESNQTKFMTRETYPPASFFGNLEPVVVDFGGDSIVANKSIHEASVSSANQTKLTVTSGFANLEPMIVVSHEGSVASKKQAKDSLEGEVDASTSEGIPEASISSINKAKSTVTPLRRGIDASISFFCTPKSFVPALAKKAIVVHEANPAKLGTPPLRMDPSTSVFGNLEPMVADSHEGSLTSMKQVKDTTPLEGDVDASTSFFGHSKPFGERTEGFHEVSISCAKRAKSTVTPLRKGTDASTSFFGTPKSFVPNLAKKPEVVHEASVFSANHNKLRTPPLRTNPPTPVFGSLEPRVADFLNKRSHEGSNSSVNQAKLITPFEGEVDASKSFVPKSAERPETSISCPNQAKSTPTPLQRKSGASTSFFDTSKSFVPNKSKDTYEAYASSANQTKLGTRTLQTNPSTSVFGNLEPMVVDFQKMSTLTKKRSHEGLVSSMNQSKVTNLLEEEVAASSSLFGNSKPFVQTFADRSESLHEAANQAKTTATPLQRGTNASTLCFEQNLSKRSKSVNEALHQTKPTPISLERSIPHASTSYLEEQPSFAAIYTPKRGVFASSTSFYCTPNDISIASSINCSKFLAGLTRTSTPLLPKNNSSDESFDESISYSPLCPSPQKNLPSTSTNPKPKKRFGMRCNKFIPPNKLTKRQIEEEFAEQTRKMMESSDSSKISDYARQICNRPTVKQLQQSEHIASIKRTEDGVVVIPAADEKMRERKRHLSFNAPYKKVFEPNLLSDANEEKFIEFLERSKKSTNVEVQQKQTEMDVSNSVSITPDGCYYYKEHKVKIKRIVEKYLQPQEEENSDYNTASDLFE